MGVILVRQARPDDGDALSRIHAEVARYYVGLAPKYFQLPELRGFGQEFDGVSQSTEGRALRLVAEADGEVVGALAARLLRPDQEATRKITSDAEALHLRIDYLATTAARRRQGVGTLLVEAAEAWGRQAGATIAETSACDNSPLSVPFWEDRMGYDDRSVGPRKPL
jgi:GNAT superfamily N-acetyltransferase